VTVRPGLHAPLAGRGSGCRGLAGPGHAGFAITRRCGSMSGDGQSLKGETMQIPQVPERVKEAPAQALRAVFAGIGQLLLIADRIKNSEPGHERAEPAAAGRTDDAWEQGAVAPAAWPVPNYDDLSLASLRGRLRNLDQAQLRVLVDYERAHAGREAVIAMFERRIAKLEITQD
jgi:hypothetical protein